MLPSTLRMLLAKESVARAAVTPPPPPSLWQPAALSAASRFDTSLQAWLHDFKTNRALAIVQLDRSIFGHPLRKDILHRAVVWIRDGMRQGTHSTKGRSDVRGSTRRPWPQKGTGRARHGSIRAAQWRGGGVVFGPKPRDHSSKLPRKVQRMAMRVALSTKYAQDQLLIVDQVCTPDSLKTRDFYHHVIRHNRWSSSPSSPSFSMLLLLPHAEQQRLTLVQRVAGNIPGVEVRDVATVNVYELLRLDKLIVEWAAIKQLEKYLHID